MLKKTQKAAIITVNWNGKRMLKDFFENIRLQNYRNFDVYFVDNGSTDGSVEFVTENYPETKIVELGRNTGFAKGNNEGIKVALTDADVEFIVCVNNDTIPEKNWLKGLVEAVNYDKKVDMATSMALFTEGNVQTVGLSYQKDLMGNSIGGLSIGFGESPEKFSRAQEVYCPSGVSVLFTRRLIEEVGMFDEDYFCYVEDYDLGMRARAKGYRCMFTPESRLVHLHSQTSGGRASAFKSFLIKRNSYFTAIKNFSQIDLLLYPFRDALWMLKNIRVKDQNRSSNILKNKVGKSGMLKIVLKAYWEVFLNLPKMLVKRYKIKKY